MREELERENQGSALSQFFNRPKIIATLFLLVVGLIVWTFWPQTPLDPKTLFDKGQALMQSDNPSDWEDGWNKYLSVLVHEFPDNSLSQEAEALHRQADSRRTLRRTLNKHKTAAMSDAQRFYQKGLRQFEAGDLEEARRTWNTLATAFALVDADKPWVILAREGAKALNPDAANEAGRIEALEARLREVWAADKSETHQAARDSFKAFESLYRDDPLALERIHQAQNGWK